MIYPEYVRYKIKYEALQERFTEVLMEKEKAFANTQPSGIRYDKEPVQCSGGSSPLEEYAANIDEIDEKLDVIRTTIADWKILLETKERELRRSKVIPDRIYTMKYLDGYGMSKIAYNLNYSRTQVYRIYRKILKTCDKMAQNVTK